MSRTTVIAAARRGAHSLLQRCGYDVHQHPPADFDEATVELIRFVRPYTATSPARIFVLRDTVRQLVQSGIEGAFVESGVWRGGSMMAIAKTLLDMGIDDRDLYLFDTFDGMVEPTDKDVRVDGASAGTLLRRARRAERSIWMVVDLEQVRRNMESTGYPPDRIHYIQGDVTETAEDAAPDQIALARLDTDWYESTLAELTAFYPRLSSGGALLLDDYGHWMGVTQATDEYFAGLDRAPLLHRVDDAARIAIKP